LNSISLDLILNYISTLLKIVSDVAHIIVPRASPFNVARIMRFGLRLLIPVAVTYQQQ